MENLNATTCLSEQISRIAKVLDGLPKTAPSPSDTPVSTTPATLAEKREAALDRLFSERVPEDYRYCVISNVAELNDSVLRARKGVYLPGNPGIGKTYAATAIAREFIARKFKVEPDPAKGEIVYPTHSIIWITAPRFLTRIRSTYNKESRKTALEIMEEFDRAFVVVLDDYGAEKPSDYAAETLYDMLTGRLNNNKFTIITTNLDAKEIAEWRPSMASRLAELKQVNLRDRDWRLIKRYQCA